MADRMTIREVATALGVSKQAIHKRINQLPSTMVSTGDNRTIYINHDGFELLRQQVSTSINQVAINQQSTSINVDTKLTPDLRHQIEVKDEEIRAKNKQIEELQKALEREQEALKINQELLLSTQELLKAQQALNAGQIQVLLNQTPEPSKGQDQPTPEEEPDISGAQVPESKKSKKSIWRFWK